MNRERRFLLTGLLLGAGSFGLLAAWQGPITSLSGQFLNNCDIDIRPVTQGEAQVYWGEAAAGTKGVRAEVWVTMNDALEAGNWDATQTRKMTIGAANLVEWRHDPSTTPPKTFLKITNNLDPILDMEVRAGGNYDPLGPMLDPIVEELRTRPPLTPGKHERRRIRVTLRNYGLSVPFTIGDV